MAAYIDQIGRKLSIPQPPSRVISLVPSITEMLFDFGLGERLIGRTKFCIHPKEIEQVPKLGGTKNPRIADILALKPDLIVANQEENREEDIDALAVEVPVYVSQVNTLESSVDLVKDLGEILQSEKASEIFQQLQVFYKSGFQTSKPRVAYLIWNDPIMTVGGDTFIHSMLKWGGYENAFAQTKRYPQLTPNELIEADLDCLFLSSEPFPFKDQHLEEFRIMLPNVKVVKVDGEAFSWYGTRPLKKVTYFKELRASL